MNYASIRKCDIANGDGVRVSLFVSGCRHHCKGCFNEEAQAFDYGQPFTDAIEEEILRALEPDFIAGLTLLGGEPLEPENQTALLPFLRCVRERFGKRKTIWVYTGCVLDLEKRVLQPSAYNVEGVTKELLNMIDVVVDGPFIEAQKDISLKFRGSSNQRILKLSAHKSAEI